VIDCEIKEILILKTLQEMSPRYVFLRMDVFTFVGRSLNVIRIIEVKFV